jgi:hypothetical protein
MDPELNQLKRAHCAVRHELIAEYHMLMKARKADPQRYNEYRRLQNQIKAKRKRLHQAAKNEVHSDFFENVGNYIIDLNHRGNPIKFEPDTSHIQLKRRILTDLEFKNRDVDTVDDAELLEDRNRSLELQLELRLELHKLNVPKPLRKRVKLMEGSELLPIPMKSSTGLEGPVRLGRWKLDPVQYDISLFEKTHCRSILRPIGFSKYSKRVVSAISLVL